MGTAWSTPLGIAGVIFLVIGIIMAIVGIILLVVQSSTTIQWYTWVLLVGGILLGIIGGIMLAVALSRVPVVEPQCYEMQTICQPVCRQVPVPIQPAPQPIYYQQTPVPVTQQVVREQIGTPTFDPNPTATVLQHPGTQQQVTAQGPYGPGGSQAIVTGTLRTPPVQETRISDIGPHPVNIAGSVPTSITTVPTVATTVPTVPTMATASPVIYRQM